MEEQPPGKRPPKRFNWERYNRLKRDATELLQMDYEDFVRVLVQDYGVDKESEAFEQATRLWKQTRGLF